MRTARDSFFECGFGVPLEPGTPLDICPCRVAQKEAYPLGCDFLEPRPVEALAFAWRGFDLEVAGMDHRPKRRIQDEPGGVGDRVMYGKSLHGNRADLLPAPGGAHPQVDILEAVLSEAIFDEGRRVRRREDRHPQLLEEVGQGSDVILVAVSDDDGFQAFALLEQPTEICVHQIGTIFIGESNAAVDGDRRVAADQGGAVHADLVEPA